MKQEESLHESMKAIHSMVLIADSFAQRGLENVSSEDMNQFLMYLSRIKNKADDVIKVINEELRARYGPFTKEDLPHGTTNHKHHMDF